MSLAGDLRIALAEYESSSASITTRARLKRVSSATGTTSANSMSFDFELLAVAVARCIFSQDPCAKEMFYEAVSALYGLRNTIDLSVKSSPRYLCLVPDFQEKYRDFSKSSRIGELAQGLGYLFVTAVLGYSVHVDFQEFLRRFSLSMPPNSRTPDFVISSLRLGKFALYESKGSYPVSKGDGLKPKIREALEQCDNGAVYLDSVLGPGTVTNKYACAVWFAKDADPWKTTLHFADPVLSNESLLHWHRLVRLHYASWFALLGCRDVVDYLVNGEAIPSRFRPKNTFIHDGQLFFSFDLDDTKDAAAWHIEQISGHELRFGMKVETWNALERPGDELLDNVEALEIFDPQQKELIRDVSQRRRGTHKVNNLFSDGTLVLRR